MFLRVLTHIDAHVSMFSGEKVGKLTMGETIYLLGLPELEVLRGHIDWVIRAMKGEQVGTGELTQKLDEMGHPRFGHGS